jgi:hypothetical protein
MISSGDIFKKRSGNDVLPDQQFGVAPADERKEQHGIGPVTELEGIAGKKHERNGTLAADVGQQRVKHIVHHEAAADEKIVHTAVHRQFEGSLQSVGRQFVRIKQHGQFFLVFLLGGQEVGVDSH